MASSYLEVGSAGLTELKNDLTNLSKALHELYELMNADMRQVGNAWRDGKYEEFISGYKPQIAKCEEISERYAEWCKNVLEPAIEECIAIETTDVGGDGGGSIGGGTSDGDIATSQASESGNSIADRFNLGGGKKLSEAEKTEKFRQGTARVQELINKKSTPGPQGSGFATPQNERPHLSPLQLNQLLNGKQR